MTAVNAVLGAATTVASPFKVVKIVIATMAVTAFLAMGLGQLLSDQQKEELDKQARATRNRLKARETEIDKSNASAEEKARLKSEARMTSVWSMYCHIQPTNAICSSKTAAEEAAVKDQQTQAQEPAK